MFSALKKVNLSSVLYFVNQRCHFTDALVHILGRYTKHSTDERILVACLMAWGTNMGIGQMGETSDTQILQFWQASLMLRQVPE